MKLYKKRVAVILVLYLCMSFMIEYSEAAKGHLRHKTNAHKENVDSSKQEGQTSNNEKNQINIGDSFFYIFLKVWLTELVDKTFISAMLLSLIYGPGFANTAYLLGAGISCTISAFMGKAIDIIPDLIMNLVSAFIFFLFGFHSFIYVYEHKNDTDFLDSDFGRWKSDPFKEGKNKNDEESEGFIDKYQKKFEKKARDHVENQIKEEIFGTPRASETDTPENGKKKSKGFFRTVFNYNFLQKKPMRFLFATILYVIADFNDDSFEEIWKFRKNNSFFKVLFASLLVYVVCGILLLVFGFLVKKRLMKRLIKSPDSIKIIKACACAVLIFISFIELFD